MENKHIGSSFDDFLAEEGRLEQATATAMKRIIAWQIARKARRGRAPVEFRSQFSSSDDHQI